MQTCTLPCSETETTLPERGCRGVSAVVEPLLRGEEQENQTQVDRDVQEGIVFVEDICIGIGLNDVCENHECFLKHVCMI